MASSLMQEQKLITNSSIVTAVTHQVATNLAGEIIVLNLQSGMYFSLEGVGARVWDLIQEPRKVNFIKDTILVEYAVEPERCEQDLLALLQKLASAGLVEISDETAA